MSSTISGFASGDTIDLVGITATSAEDTKGTLDVYDATTLVNSFKVSGNYKGANFDVNPSADGSAITLDPSQPPGLPVVTANPITLSVPQSIEGAAGTAVNVNGLSVSDTAPGVTVTVELSTTTGLLSANTGAPGGGGTITIAPDGTGLVITGTLNQVNADLTTVSYTATAAGTDTIEAFASDTANDADGDSTAVTTSDEAPTLMVPGAQTVTAGTATPITGIDITDPASTGATFTVTLSDSTGTLSADGDGASTTTGVDTNTLTISGDLADVDDDLASLTIPARRPVSRQRLPTRSLFLSTTVMAATPRQTIGVTIDQAIDETPSRRGADKRIRHHRHAACDYRRQPGRQRHAREYLYRHRVGRERDTWRYRLRRQHGQRHRQRLSHDYGRLCGRQFRPLGADLYRRGAAFRSSGHRYHWLLSYRQFRPHGKCLHERSGRSAGLFCVDLANRRQFRRRHELDT